MGILQQSSLNDGNNGAMNKATIGLTMIFLFSFGISLGPIAWIYEPEILPEKGVSLAGFAHWLFCVLVVFVSPIIIDLIM